MAKPRIIDLGYRPRPQFEAFHRRKQRWACVVSHVRAGKTVSCIMDLVDAALRCPLPEPRFAYVAPYYAQAKDVAWSYLKRFTLPIPGAEPNEAELRVDLPNGGRVRLYGADNYNRMRGIYLDGVVLDEPADMHPAAWPEVIRPRLSDRSGWAAFIGTPKGRNEFFAIREQARTSPDWFHMELRADETGILPEHELLAAQRDMTPEQYAQEYLCSFDAAIIGAYYGRELNEIERMGHFCSLSRIPEMPVFTVWDLGMGDSTAIFVFQVVNGEVHVLDHIENHGQPLDWYVKELNARGWQHCAIDWLPHDARVRSLETGRTRVETLIALKRKPKLVPAHKVEDGINAVRLMLPRTWFDEENCAKAIECLRQYRTDYDAKDKVFRNKPRHDWTSHTADAARYMAIAHREIAPSVRATAPTSIVVPPITVNSLLRASKPQRKWE